jgi:dTDP-4-dehydrorhamnose 3,5-epimerase
MNCGIDGVIIRELKRYDDSRGWLTELFRQDEMQEEHWPVMAYVSMTKPGVTRGPHEHVDQADQFAFIGPSTFRLYLWDSRAESATFGQKATLEVGEQRPVAVIVPRGVVHAYKNIGSAEGIVFNAPNRLYAGQGKKEPVDEIRHEDTVGSPYAVD